MTDKTKFRPVTGKDEAIQNAPKNPGWVYFASDTGKIYFDLDVDTRVAMGGSGVSLLYGNAGTIEPDEYSLYHLSFEHLEEDVVPKEGDLILNQDGIFYRVQEVNTAEETFACTIMSVSGGGGGGGGANFAKRIGITMKSLATSNLLNKQVCEITYTANSGIDVDGSIMDERLTVHWSLSEKIGSGSTEYANGIIDVVSGSEEKFEFGTKLRDNATTILTMYAEGINSGESTKKSVTVMTSELALTPSANFSALTRYTPDKVLLQCNVVGAMDKVLDFYWDGELVKTYNLTSENTGFQSYQISSDLATHGSHKCRIELYQGIKAAGGVVERGLDVDPLEFEIGVFEVGNTTPVIWLGNYQSTYYNYDNIQIPFLAYDPSNSNQITVNLKKNGIELPGSPRTIDTTKMDKWNLFEITDAEMEKQNRYSISCGDVERNITFEVIQDPSRKMEYVKPESLVLQFDAKGRTNNESAVVRQTWENADGSVKAQFKDFNWYNNGWMFDENNQTCLRISNGAEFSLPIGPMTFNESTIGKDSNSIEIQFRVRNVQDYSNLIKNVTRYSGDEDFYTAFMKQTRYDNYDAFLQYWLPIYPLPEGVTEDKRVQYDDLEFSRVQKNITLDKAVCSYYSGDSAGATGLCLGPQDAFFSNGTDTVSVEYVEGKMVYLTMVFSKTSQLMYIYINGVITGVIKASASDAFTIESDKLVFNSNFCDIDLYKIRIYNTDLNVNDVVTNHSVDKKDVLIYDQNKLAVENDSIKEYQFKFEEMIKYNEAHPDAPLMPYIVYDTSLTGDDRLPWSKKTSISAKIEFVNTVLDAAFASGELLDLAIKDGLCTATSSAEDKEAAVRKYYEHHCPSWTGDYCELVVQGTSSEFYPRRNYKIKLKTDYHPSGKKYYHCLLNKGPFSQTYLDDVANLAAGTTAYGEEATRREGWYMDNYTNKTDRWTMKVDYMESSGSYNAGFASLVGTAYSKHPLKDYIDKGAISNSEELITDVIPGNTDIRWQDFRTSLKGFPVLAFHKKSDGSYLYVGMYRMLLDKGSDEVLGFDLPKAMTGNFLGGKKMKDMVECWEFCNNARGFCSYRDPWNRVELSFKAPKGVANEFTSGGAPIICDNIEYRYNANEDYIDILLDLIDKDGKVAVTPEDNEDIKKEFGEEYDVIADPDKGRELIYKFYKNWEDVNKWVWSTNTDNVVSEGTYELASVGNIKYEPGKYYVYDDDLDEYVLDEATAEWDKSIDYFEKKTDKNDEGEEVVSYAKAFVALGDYLWSKDAIGKFYSKNGDAYSVINDSDFNSEIDYYELVVDETYKQNADRLVAVCMDEAYDASKEYYTYDGSVTVGTRAAVKVENSVVEADYAPGKYYVPAPVKYGIRIYEYDTKEYRAAKFVNELTKHFDPEYLATYFIMTEVFECYDSRGKNCMMASWGPHEEGGNWIWYPIFYDIDTQLGINNTGIPSFEYNVDATEAGNYSTSDSLLWNNFYKYFKNSYILMKYKHLRGTTTGVSWPKLSMPTLEKIETIEDWYNFDVDATGSLTGRGVKPLIATNLDMWWKYITITNNLGTSKGLTGWLNRDGTYVTDTNGTYFYALQGDRSLSRQQFLTNRIEYIDSWLNQGNYQRGGSNNIRGRVAANNPTKTSDKWVNSTETPYYDENGNKRYPFDAEYWINLKPIRSSYVTVSDDAEAYPSQKYDGVNPVKFDITAIQNGVMNSANYPEQLLYIYGMNKMADLGEMHNLYWQEFDLTGDATHLTTLKLGYDGVEIDPDTGAEITWRNDKINQPSIPGSKDDTFGGMPLLKEVNLSNLQVSTGSPTLDFSSCEKLQNFRATGSNFVAFNFAEGVALHTLYLPSSITRLELTEANLLTNLITEYKAPERDQMGNLVAEKGLYLQSMFEEDATSINTLNFRGGNLGYDGYKLLNKYFTIRDRQTTTSKIQMTKVNWCPYVQLVEGDVYDKNAKYFKDNGHYGFTPYTEADYDVFKFDIDIANGELYRLDESIAAEDINQIADINMLKTFINEDKYQGMAGNVPNITGIIYVNNAEDSPVDELYVRNTLVKNYPSLTFFFAHVTQANSAKFIIMEEDGTYTYVANANPQNTEVSVQKIADGQWFQNPYKLYNPMKDNYDFHGWSTTNSLEGLISSADASQAEQQAAWDALQLEEGKKNYVFYAIFTIHEWEIRFWAGANEQSLQSAGGYTIVHGQDLYDIPDIPSIPETGLDDEERYRFLGWTQNVKNLIADNASTAKVVNVNTIVASQDMDFYGVFVKESVYASATDMKYFNVDSYTYIDQFTNELIEGYSIYPKVNLSGKVTIPTEYNNKPIVQVDGFKGSNITHIFWYGDPKVVEIAQNGFAECSQLQKFAMPKSMRRLGASCFSGCSSLAVPTDLADTQVSYIGNYAYTGALKITNTVPVLQLPATVKQIGNNAFAYFINISAGSGPVIETVNFGKPGSPSALTTVGTTPFIQNERQINNINIYVAGGVADPTLQALVTERIKPTIAGSVSYPSA